jgi:hypothetical protein
MEKAKPGDGAINRDDGKSKRSVHKLRERSTQFLWPTD